MTHRLIESLGGVLDGLIGGIGFILLVWAFAGICSAWSKLK